jgi:NADH-quinone oxidoreductase subunit I
MKKLINKTLSGIIEIARGMFTILKHVFRPAITLEYPEKRPVFNSRIRGRLALVTNHDGSLVCLGGCKSCTKVCPCGDLIQIETSKDENNKTVVDKFTIDIGRCIFCGNCTQACPNNALIMIDEYELANYSRESLVFDKDRLKLSPAESERWKERKEQDN